jgi:hypothetical protein
MSSSGIIVSSICIAGVLAAVLTVVLLRLYRISGSVVSRAAALVAVILVLLLSPAVVDTLVVSFNRNGGASYLMVDPGLTAKVAPAIVAIATAILDWMLSSKKYKR